jgi:hypothetical protein
MQMLHMFGGRAVLRSRQQLIWRDRQSLAAPAWGMLLYLYSIAGGVRVHAGAPANPCSPRASSVQALCSSERARRGHGELLSARQDVCCAGGTEESYPSPDREERVMERSPGKYAGPADGEPERKSVQPAHATTSWNERAIAGN